MYFTYQLQRGLQEPLHLWAYLQKTLWSHPALPETPFTRTLAAALNSSETDGSYELLPIS